MSEQKSRWGSLLSGAVAGLESKLDVILADDKEASAKSRAEDAAKKAKAEKEKALRAEQDASRPSSQNRANERLQARLAKAVARNGESSKPSSNPSSGPATPQVPSPALHPSKPRSSTDTQNLEAIIDGRDAAGSTQVDQPGPADDAPTDTARPPAAENDVDRKTPELESQRDDEQSETLEYLERIDGLHAKIAYLSSQLSENAAAEASKAPDSSPEKKIAEQNEKIAQLLQEGEKLSRNEVRHREALKKLRSRLQEEEKKSVELRARLEKAEADVRDLREFGRVADAKEKALNDKISSLLVSQRSLDATISERDSLSEEVRDLGKRLDDSEQRAHEADKKGLSSKVEEQKGIIANLEEELANSRIEKRLVEDRVKSEMNEIKQLYNKELEKCRLTEKDLKSEVQNLEASMEVLRSRTEEVSASNTQDSQTKLLRQIETLQTQYSLASDNWQGIESSLNARVTALERERDDLAKRESDGRKRTREVNGKARRLEDELEASKDQNSTLEAQVSELKAALTSMESRLNLAEKDASDAKSKISGFDAVLRSRIDEEKVKWRAEMQTYEPPYDPSPSMFRVNPSLSINQRKASSPDLTGSRRSHLSGRVQGLDLSSLLPGEHSRNSSRWSNAQAHPGAPLRTPTDPTFIARHDLSPPLHNGTPPPIESTAPSIHTINPDDDDGIEVGDAASHSSPQRTVAELLSASTSGAGPSVQLVERLSATVRRLETERGATREELARLQAQRDGARDEVVGAMREVDALRGENSALAGLREEVARLRERHDAALEMLGEKSEECDELKNDIVDLKKIYRELVESTMQ